MAGTPEIEVPEPHRDARRPEPRWMTVADSHRIVQFRLWHLCFAIVCVGLLMAIDPSQLPPVAKIMLLIFAAVVTAISLGTRKPWLTVATWASFRPISPVPPTTFVV